MNREQPLAILFFGLRRQLLSILLIVGSVLLCALLSFARLPGMELLGIGPNWLLIWVVVWSLPRSTFQGVIAGMALGWIQDGLTSTYPSHALSLALVGFLAARLGKNRYLRDNFLALIWIVFVLAGLAEIATALQYVLQEVRSPADIWRDCERIALSSAILSSLWAPAFAYPFNCCWEKLRKL
jgi:rod shape-determining protein MreD